jgi:hypothetical protein
MAEAVVGQMAADGPEMFMVGRNSSASSSSAGPPSSR